MPCGGHGKRKTKSGSSDSDAGYLVDSDSESEYEDLYDMPPGEQPLHYSPTKRVKVGGIKKFKATGDDPMTCDLLDAMEESAYQEVMSGTSMMSLNSEVKVKGFKSKGQNFTLTHPGSWYPCVYLFVICFMYNS